MLHVGASVCYLVVKSYRVPASRRHLMACTKAFASPLIKSLLASLSCSLSTFGNLLGGRSASKSFWSRPSKLVAPLPLVAVPLPLVLASVNDLGNGIGIFSAGLLGVEGGVTAAALGATTGAGAGAGVGATTGVGTGAGLVTTGGVGVEGLGGLTGAAAGFGAGAGVLDLLAG